MYVCMYVCMYVYGHCLAIFHSSLGVSLSVCIFLSQNHFFLVLCSLCQLADVNECFACGGSIGTEGSPMDGLCAVCMEHGDAKGDNRRREREKGRWKRVNREDEERGRLAGGEGRGRRRREREEEGNGAKEG